MVDSMSETDQENLVVRYCNQCMLDSYMNHQVMTRKFWLLDEFPVISLASVASSNQR